MYAASDITGRITAAGAAGGFATGPWQPAQAGLPALRMPVPPLLNNAKPKISCVVNPWDSGALPSRHVTVGLPIGTVVPAVFVVTGRQLANQLSKRLWSEINVRSYIMIAMPQNMEKFVSICV